ncbi:MAG: nicotinate-nucleotide adenylyltransferase [Candidatus Scalinduaceae bacterium]
MNLKNRDNVSDLTHQRRIGVFGGTFNPIHKGHLVIAEEVYKYHHLSKVLFIPANIPPHKYAEDLIDAHHRYKMVEEAIRGNDKLEVSDFEIKREGKSYTIDTVQDVLRSYGKNCEIFLIIGADSLNELELWKDIKKLSELCHFVIVNRPGYPTDVSGSLADVIGKDKVLDMERLKVQISPIGISSTDIRKRLREGADVSGLVPPCVEAYIREHGLYSPARAGSDGCCDVKKA